MTSLIDFQFSQASLQDYDDCPRLFQLRHVDRRRWPALEVEPAMENERYLRQGAAFHRLIQQHLTGISAKRLWPTVPEALRSWWRNYLESGPADLPRTRHPEVALSAALGAHRLVAKYDLVAVDAGDRGVIVDWKTNRKRPRREWLAKRLQTRVYPYLLVRAGAELNNGEPFRPEQVEMIYWFANAPTRPERFVYSADQHEADEASLMSLIKEIDEKVGALGEEELLSRADDERACRYCRYRSLCQRGIGAGPFDEAGDEATSTEDFGFEIDFEQIAEVEY